MPAKKYRIALEKSEVRSLEDITKKGKHSSRVITRARVLLMANEKGLSKIDQEIAEWLHITVKTVENIRQRYCINGIGHALYDRQRPGQPRKLTVVDEAKIIAIACTDPPDGYDRWSLALLTEAVNSEETDIAVKVSRSTIYRRCLQRDLKPWLKKNVVYTKA